MSRMLRVGMGALLLAGLSDFAFAQRATVQQPVIQRFGVGTTVSVPDRGRAHLGSVSSAGSSRKSFGPFVPGASRGFFRNHSSTTVGVTIHDLAEMDRQLLGQATPRVSAGPKLNPLAGHAWRTLAERHTRNRSTASAAGSSSPTITHRRRNRVIESPPPVGREITAARRTARRKTNPGGYAAKFLADGIRAENRGATSLARNYYRVAARLGSKEAKRRMSAIDRMRRLNDLP